MPSKVGDAETGQTLYEFETVSGVLRGTAANPPFDRIAVQRKRDPIDLQHRLAENHGQHSDIPRVGGDCPQALARPLHRHAVVFLVVDIKRVRQIGGGLL